MDAEAIEEVVRELHDKVNVNVTERESSLKNSQLSGLSIVLERERERERERESPGGPVARACACPAGDLGIDSQLGQTQTPLQT